MTPGATPHSSKSLSLPPQDANHQDSPGQSQSPTPARPSFPGVTLPVAAAESPQPNSTPNGEVIAASTWMSSREYEQLEGHAPSGSRPIAKTIRRNSGRPAVQYEDPSSDEYEDGEEQDDYAYMPATTHHGSSTITATAAPIPAPKARPTSNTIAAHAPYMPLQLVPTSQFRADLAPRMPLQPGPGVSYAETLPLGTRIEDWMRLTRRDIRWSGTIPSVVTVVDGGEMVVFGEGRPGARRKAGRPKKSPQEHDTIMGGDAVVDDSADEGLWTLHDFPGDVKPPYSYAQMARYAILGSPIKKLSLSDIYVVIEAKWGYYRNVSAQGWRNSVRHNLSLNTYFIKTQRALHEPGIGSLWAVDPTSTGAPKRQRKRKRKTAADGTEAPGTGPPNEPSQPAFTPNVVPKDAHLDGRREDSPFTVDPRPRDMDDLHSRPVDWAAGGDTIPLEGGHDAMDYECQVQDDVPIDPVLMNMPPPSTVSTSNTTLRTPSPGLAGFVDVATATRPLPPNPSIPSSSSIQGQQLLTSFTEVLHAASSSPKQRGNHQPRRSGSSAGVAVSGTESNTVQKRPIRVQNPESLVDVLGRSPSGDPHAIAPPIVVRRKRDKDKDKEKERGKGREEHHDSDRRPRKRQRWSTEDGVPGREGDPARVNPVFHVGATQPAKPKTTKVRKSMAAIGFATAPSLRPLASTTSTAPSSFSPVAPPMVPAKFGHSSFSFPSAPLLLDTSKPKPGGFSAFGATGGMSILGAVAQSKAMTVDLQPAYPFGAKETAAARAERERVERLAEEEEEARMRVDESIGGMGDESDGDEGQPARMMTIQRPAAAQKPSLPPQLQPALPISAPQPQQRFQEAPPPPPVTAAPQTMTKQPVQNTDEVPYSTVIIHHNFYPTRLFGRRTQSSITIEYRGGDDDDKHWFYTNQVPQEPDFRD